VKRGAINSLRILILSTNNFYHQNLSRPPPHEYLPKVAEILGNFFSSHCNVTLRVSYICSLGIYCYLLFPYQLQNLISEGRYALKKFCQKKIWMTLLYVDIENNPRTVRSLRPLDPGNRCKRDSRYFSFPAWGSGWLLAPYLTPAKVYCGLYEALAHSPLHQ